MKQPNILLILTDDQGYGDLSCMGSPDFRTPHLDRLAASGVRFTSWYANSAVCSPSRAALLTGRYPVNAGVRNLLSGHRATRGLPPQVPTLAAALKKLGYQTAMFGKWHLGLAAGSRPEEHGFDESLVFMAGCVDYFSHIYYHGMNLPGTGKNPAHDLWHNGQETWEYNGRYLTELFTEKAVKFIRSSARQGQPFIAYVAYNAPHYPMHAPQKYMDRFAHLPWDRQIMAAMVSAVDDGVGEMLAELERQSVLENTLVVFMSDNGPSRESRNWMDGRLDPYYGGTTGGFKGHKHSLFEGGIRVPGILSLPGRISPGQVIDTPCAGMDVFPTALHLAGGDPGAYELDGADLFPHLAEEVSLAERDLFWELGQQLAIRRGDWKLVLNGQLVEGEPAQDPMFLSNLKDDPSERINWKDQQPALVKQLYEAAEGWKIKVEARWQQEFASALQK